MGGICFEEDESITGKSWSLAFFLRVFTCASSPVCGSCHCWPALEHLASLEPYARTFHFVIGVFVATDSRGFDMDDSRLATLMIL
jgi:hypothetical protein